MDGRRSPAEPCWRPARASCMPGLVIGERLCYAVSALGEYEGVWPEDECRPQRFFSFRSDAQIHTAVSPFFEQVSFRRIAGAGRWKARVNSTSSR